MVTAAATVVSLLWPLLMSTVLLLLPPPLPARPLGSPGCLLCVHLQGQTKDGQSDDIIR